jgi:hypothetical protein
MAFGLTIKNTSGFYQMTDQTPVLSFVRKFQVTGSPDAGRVFWPVDFDGEFPLIAVRCTTGQMVGSWDAEPSGWGGSGYHGLFVTAGSTALILEVFLFDILPTTTTLPAYGVKLLTAASRVGYHSNSQPLKLAYEGVLNRSNVGATFALDSTRTYATLFGRFFNGPFAYSGYELWRLGFNLPIGGSTGSHSYIVTNTFGTAQNYEVHTGTSYVVDVTGL